MFFIMPEFVTFTFSFAVINCLPDLKEIIKRLGLLLQAVGWWSQALLPVYLKKKSKCILCYKEVLEIITLPKLLPEK